MICGWAIAHVSFIWEKGVNSLDTATTCFITVSPFFVNHASEDFVRLTIRISNQNNKTSLMDDEPFSPWLLISKGFVLPPRAKISSMISLSFTSACFSTRLINSRFSKGKRRSSILTNMFICYTDTSCGLDGRVCKILTSISQQSLNIANGIDHDNGKLAAGDQGMLFGYATDETPKLC